jgi:tRNA G18 (ribose-2'-O)-methylase SpoU
MKKLTNKELGRLSPEEFKEAKKMPIVVVLDNVRSAYNVGSVFRTCDAFPVQALYLCGITCYPPHKEILKTALGSHETVTWKKFATTPQAIAELKQEGYKIYAIEQAEQSLSLNDLARHQLKDIPMALVFGHEVEGVHPEVMKLCDGAIEIPQGGTKHSLNIAVCAGVVLWEFFRK